MPLSSSDPANYAGALRRGAMYNFLGGIAKLAQPLSFLCVTWLWGPTIMGAYLLGQSLLEIVSATLSAGYADATTVFASRHVELAESDPAHERALYRVLANTFAITTGLSSIVALGSLLCAGPLVEHAFPNYRALLPGLYWLAFSLLPRSLGLVAIAATKAMMRMEHDALLYGLLHPLAILAGYLVVFLAGGGLSALFAVQLLVELVVCVLALSAFARYFSLRSVLASVRSWQWDRALLAFAIPQSFNLTFNRYITRIDSIMLASFGLAQVDLAYFGTAAYLTSNIGQIRGIFSGALGPVLARLHVRGERAAFEAELSRVCRWTTSLAVPLVLVLVIVRTDVMRLVSESYVGNSLFIVVLLIPPLTNCAYGMAGACLMFTGHSKVILTNSLCVALLNTGLTYLLIPRYGMLGAAVATAVATSITTGLQVFELWRLEGLRIRASAVWKPHVGFALGALLLALLWDPSALGLSARITVACAMGIGFLLLMLALRLEELRPLAARARRELPGA